MEKQSSFRHLGISLLSLEMCIDLLKSLFMATIHIVDRPATQKFRFNKPANKMDNFRKKLIIWVLND